MAELDTSNLIDFSSDDLLQLAAPPSQETELPTDGGSPIETIPSHTIAFVGTMLPTLATDGLFSPHTNSSLQIEKQDSLENNPFDSVQKMACRPSDPFDIVEKEACLKARSMLSTNVTEANLLSLSNESDRSRSANCNVNNSDNTNAARASIECEENNNSTNPCNESTDTPTGRSNRSKGVEQRKRLLKLSLSNSTINSPVSRNTLSAQESLDENSTISMILSEAAQLGENLLAQESPVKFVDDEIISGQDINLSDSAQNFDDDLAMLNIPMLKQLPLKEIHDEDPPSLLALRKANECGEHEAQKPTSTASLMDLDAIRAKLKSKRDLSNDNQDISLLIKSIKSLVSDIKADDMKKKEEAANLLDTLSSALGGATTTSAATQSGRQNTPLAPPQPIIRQGTFDIELQQNEEQNKIDGTNNVVEAETKTALISPSINDVPDVMFKSSATYDGECAEEKQDLLLPEIQIQPPATTQPPPPLDVNDIVEQLGKLLEQHQLNNVLTSDAGAGESGAQNTPTGNPTFIVVMNTPQQSNNSPLENSFNSNDFFENADTLIRRRSQSLSIHDKIRIVHLPFVPSKAGVARAPVENGHAETKLVSPPTPDPQANNEFKTPLRTMRRNSISSGTPYTSKYSNLSSITQRRSSGITERSSHMQSRGGSSSLATHHERQESNMTPSAKAAIVRPMPHVNLNLLKPQFNVKKKPKPGTVSASILKSSGPLKATIPVKKVAPILMKTSPNRCAAIKPQSTANTSMEVLTRTSKLSCSTSTPPLVTSMHTPSSASLTASSSHHLNNNTLHDVSSGFPNACSTPTVGIGSLQRAAFGANKLRHSYLTAAAAVPNTNNLHPSTPVAAGAVRRRSMGQFKLKSPIKSRIGGAAAAASDVRSTVKATSNTSVNKNNKLTPTISGKAINNLRTRTSLGGRASSAIAATATTFRNKENKP